METINPPSDQRFRWLPWLLANVAGWTALTVGLGLVFTIRTINEGLANWFYILLLMSGGAMLSVGQAFALRRRVPNPAKWALGTFSGWVLGGLLVWSAGDSLPWLAHLFIPPITLAAVQWFFLLRNMPGTNGLKWAAATFAGSLKSLIIGGGMSWAFLIGIADIAIHGVDAEVVAVAAMIMTCPGVAAGICSGAITGAALRSILHEQAGTHIEAKENAA